MRIQTLILLLAIVQVPLPSQTAAEHEDLHDSTPFLPAWHFFQSATAFEATGELQLSIRAINTALRLEPVVPRAIIRKYIHIF